MAEVVLDHVTKIFPGNVVAVRDATLQVKDLELMVLVGPSGCGKSTTLRMVAGLEEITEGTISIAGRVVNDVPPKDRDIAMVFQNYALYPHMTVYNNMAFGLKLRRYPRSEIERRVREAAQILGIENLLDRKPKALSGGQRQRVAVGRAIVRKPSVFLFDEPLSNLDAKLRVEMRAELNKLHRRLETTMIYVTHDQVEAMTLGDRIAVMRDGTLQQVAPPLEIYERPVNKFVAGFIGTPPMNFLDGQVVAADGRLYFDEGTCRLPLPGRFAEALGPVVGRPATLGLRPELLEPVVPGQGTGDGATFRAKVNVVEPLGDEMLVYLSTGKHDLIAKVGSHHRLEVGEEIEVAARMDRSHVFDQQSEKNLTATAKEA